MRIIAALFYAWFATAAMAQNILVPTRPAGDNTNAAASTAFVQNTLSGGGGLTQSANTVFAGPASGAAAVPAFRSLVTADIPSTLATGISSIGVDTYNAGSNSGQTAFQITNSDNSALSLEHYTAWIGATTNGTGNGAITATSFALGLSAIKNNWTTTTTAGEYAALNVVARGGDNNVLTSGDVAGITVNTGASFSNNFVTQFEGVSAYLPGGSTTNSLDINVQLGSLRASGLNGAADTGIGFYAQAQNGSLGNAIELSNLCTTPKYNLCSKWLNAFVYAYDDGTHTPYQAFVVNQLGQIQIAGFGAAGTNQKTIRVGSSATNVFGITNAAASVEILSLTDAGALSTTAGFVGGSGAGSSLILQSTTGVGTTDFISLQTGSQIEDLRIDSAGRQLTGLTTALTNGTTTFLNVQNAGTTQRGLVGGAYGLFIFSNDTSSSFLGFYKNRNTVKGTGQTTVQNGDDVGELQYNASDGTNYINSGYFTCTTDNTISTGIVPMGCEWGLMNSAGTLAERMRLTSDGNLAVRGAFSTSTPRTVSTATYTTVTTDSSLIFTSAGTVTLTLTNPPGPIFTPGRWLLVKNTTTTTLNSASSNIVPLAGGAAGTAILTATGKWAWLQWDGTNWNIMSAN